MAIWLVCELSTRYHCSSRNRYLQYFNIKPLGKHSVSLHTAAHGRNFQVFYVTALKRKFSLLTALKIVKMVNACRSSDEIYQVMCPFSLYMHSTNISCAETETPLTLFGCVWFVQAELVIGNHPDQHNLNVEVFLKCKCFTETDIMCVRVVKFPSLLEYWSENEPVFWIRDYSSFKNIIWKKKFKLHMFSLKLLPQFSSTATFVERIQSSKCR